MSSRVAIHALAVLTLASLLVLGGLASGVAADGHELIIEQHGSGLALEDESTTYLWKHSSYSVTVTFAAVDDGIHTVCLGRHDDDTVEQPLVCQWTTASSDEPTTVTLTQPEWSEELAGEETVSIEVYPGRDTNAEPIVTQQQAVHIIEKDGDLAGNGLSNEREIELGTHPALADTDGDGLTDGAEVMLGTDPRDPMTPYRIAVVAVGSVSAAVFGVLLVAGRFMMVLQTLGISRHREPDRSDADSGPPAQTLEPPVRDEKRVTQLLSTHDGRLKQSQIVEATGWSKSKVSRLLSSMEDDGEITRIRLGRENLVCLRGHEPADITPSWDDESSSR